MAVVDDEGAADLTLGGVLQRVGRGLVFGDGRYPFAVEHAVASVFVDPVAARRLRDAAAPGSGNRSVTWAAANSAVAPAATASTTNPNSPIGVIDDSHCGRCADEHKRDVGT
ncbi:MAG: hypothetical protein ACXVRS_04580 [Gaiellaceae bacterium]